MTTPLDVVHAALYGSARALVPRSGLPTGASYLAQWSPSNVVATVPGAAARALTPQEIAQSLSPAALAQNWTQDLAAAAIVAVLL